MIKKKPSIFKRLAGKRAPNVYLSYSREDGERYTKILARILQEHGINVFLDEEISAAEKWLNIIQNQLRDADAIIFIGTPGALRSDWTRDELSFSFKRQKTPILPIMFSGIIDRQNLPFFLGTFSWVQESEQALESGPTRDVIDALFSLLLDIQPDYESREVKQETRHQKEKRPLNEGKLILVGRGEVGKTSLVRRLNNEEFRGDESKTQGINITNWFLESQSETVRLNVWDFGGQEIMHATHQFFLTERSLYLLVLNGREGGEDLDAEYWLKHIASFGGDSPIVVVQNKISQHPFELNYRGLQSAFPNIRAFVKTDCKNGTGIVELEEIVQQVVAEMPEIRMPFPTDWFNVKSRLESMEEDYMGYEEFRQLCDEEGIDDESDRDTLGWALHCLGIALNYREDSRLRETSVLRPEWVTEGIYKILNADDLAKSQGELHLNDLARLLPLASIIHEAGKSRKFGSKMRFP